MPQSTTPRTPAYAPLDRALRDAGLEGGAADAHGVLTGLLCADADGGQGRWRRHLAAEAPATRALEGELSALGEATAAQLAGDDFGFHPFLPEDDAPLAVRVRALGAWCQGFLYGLGAAGGEPADDDASEALRDLWQIAQVSDEVGEDEADEAAYAELVEYVRVAVALVREALRRAAAEEGDDGG